MSLDVDDINPEDRGYINSIPADVRTPDEEAIRQQRADFMREKVALLKGRYRRLIEFTFVGYKPCTVVMPDTLLEDRYMMGVFLSPDTLQLSEALILRRWGEVQRQNLINARNNMTGILKQAYAPVDYMDADMNQRMMLNEYARSVEMKGHVDVGIGVGTQSVDAYKMLRMRRRVKNQKEWLNPNEIDLLKKIYYLKKKEKQDN